MTEQHTPDITTGFIQMVEAFKAKPELEARINNLEHDLDTKAENESRMSQRIAQLEASLASASADKERLTRERDEAMFRSLELEEKTSAVSDLVAKLEGLVRPEPVAPSMPEAQPVAEQVHAEQGDVEHPHRSFDGPFTHLDRDGIDRNQSNDTLYKDGGPGPSFPHPEYSGQGSQHEPNAEQRNLVESQYPESNRDTMAGANVEKDLGNYYARREANTPEGQVYSWEHDAYFPDNRGKPYSDKPWWVNDNDWKAQGGQGPHEGGSWEAPLEQRA